MTTITLYIDIDNSYVVEYDDIVFRYNLKEEAILVFTLLRWPKKVYRAERLA